MRGYEDEQDKSGGWAASGRGSADWDAFHGGSRGGGISFKKHCKGRGGVRLEAVDSACKPIWVKGEMELRVFGVPTAVIHRFRAREGRRADDCPGGRQLKGIPPTLQYEDEPTSSLFLSDFAVDSRGIFLDSTVPDGRNTPAQEPIAMKNHFLPLILGLAGVFAIATAFGTGDEPLDEPMVSKALGVL